MEAAMKAIEVGGTIDEQGQLHLDEVLPSAGAGRVCVILQYPGEEEIDERTWLNAGANNSAFDFLNDLGEDIYTPADGKAFRDEGHINENPD